ncbi:hypothetical protein ACFQ14_16205 [Pseudahrensia aquimaris]|uniref:Uncharacterized protein n=1 Tax=Pseudahrensia aquimaris TaxID=744461 RepID=A0ABW3FHI9_9HYPH
MTKLAKRMAALAAIFATSGMITMGSAIVTPQTAAADSCWDHNGSLMRLVANGNQRAFYYERPSAVLRQAGVRRGTLLFNGRKQGNSYVGTARRFSKWCSAPLEYSVSGPISGNQTRVTVRGTRPVYASGCRNTGRIARDRLVFTYSHQC